jgi:hypothetical protein
MQQQITTIFDYTKKLKLEIIGTDSQRLCRGCIQNKIKKKAVNFNTFLSKKIKTSRKP